MKSYSLLCLLIFLIGACSSPESEQQAQTDHPEQSNMTEITTPDTTDYEESKVYVDSVKSTNQGLLISGNLPDGCSKLHKASHTMQGDTISIDLTAWKPSEMMCTQALTPFDFNYKKVTEQQIHDAVAITVNGKSYEVQ